VSGAVRERVKACRSSGQTIDYATFVPDGEPTLDVHLGESIRAIRAPDLRVAVLTNASLLWREDVRDDLHAADWVSLKVDAVCEEPWQRMNRPHPSLRLEDVLQGMLDFGASFDVMRRIRALAAAGLSLVIVTHHLDEIPPEVARVVLLRDGAILADGDPGDVLTDARLSDAYGTPIRVFRNGDRYFAAPR
jgi:hypothetical protein